MDNIEIDHGPAVKDRNHKKGYPFGDKYPVTIRCLKRVTSDFSWLDAGAPMSASAETEYPAWTNSYGAVSAILPDGKMLGLYPNEFEVTKWSDE